MPTMPIRMGRFGLMPPRPPTHRMPSFAGVPTAVRERPNSVERGYGTDWRKLRASMPRTPCALCGSPWASGFHLDHIIPRSKGGTDDPSNLQWLDRACHSRKTAQHDGGWGRGGGV